MRELKFRVWCKDKKQWERDSCFISRNGTLVEIRTTGEIKKYNKQNHIVMQYTGIKDKDGKEIYEGDILEKDNQRFKVKWGCSEPSFFALTKETHCNCYSVYGLAAHGAVVTGNIYENPELL